jgi:hypothetical protein
MSFEAISLLLNWMELGVLLAILFRLSSTFGLIANTQRDLRRAIHSLGERRAAEPAIEALSGGRRRIHPSLTSLKSDGLVCNNLDRLDPAPDGQF